MLRRLGYFHGHVAEKILLSATGLAVLLFVNLPLLRLKSAGGAVVGQAIRQLWRTVMMLAPAYMVWGRYFHKRQLVMIAVAVTLPYMIIDPLVYGNAIPSGPWRTLMQLLSSAGWCAVYWIMLPLYVYYTIRGRPRSIAPAGVEPAAPSSPSKRYGASAAPSTAVAPADAATVQAGPLEKAGKWMRGQMLVCNFLGLAANSYFVFTGDNVGYSGGGALSVIFWGIALYKERGRAAPGSFCYYIVLTFYQIALPIGAGAIMLTLMKLVGSNWLYQIMVMTGYGLAMSAVLYFVRRTTVFLPPQHRMATVWLVQLFDSLYSELIFLIVRPFSEGFFALITLQLIRDIMRDTGSFTYIGRRLLGRPLPALQELQTQEERWLLADQNLMAEIIAALAVPLIMVFEMVYGFGEATASSGFSDSDRVSVLLAYIVVIAVEAIIHHSVKFILRARLQASRKLLDKLTSSSPKATGSDGADIALESLDGEEDEEAAGGTVADRPLPLLFLTNRDEGSEESYLDRHWRMHRWYFLAVALQATMEALESAATLRTGGERFET